MLRTGLPWQAQHTEHAQPSEEDRPVGQQVDMQQPVRPAEPSTPAIPVASIAVRPETPRNGADSSTATHFNATQDQQVRAAGLSA